MNLNRELLQQLATERNADAEALLAAGQWAGAFYIAGYAIECGLKACISKLTKPDDFPDKNFARDCYTHNIDDLVRLAGLTADRDADNLSNAVLRLNWQTVKDWSEVSRYELTEESHAREMMKAVSDPNHGVLPWIMARW
ncbi:MAG: hypothetical protein WEB58_16175 [Planctomycetaceae bacterium]